ncbi:pyridoxamine 5'-phosphate oxidase family protein [Streptomyces sp. MST-110588]|uniref:pyridoxamine 5'-phosphate oxidase family protein n=1 Tax=Streptomyces sp. MST-110588 TaxID=2833628 RepID=UPI001F5C98BF|nr:pyridoxamine 5'-phosphate oxidase family protein [Streptomyces sp. MST-110588]UNO43380.1 pyridoxamine 5'-phosphate oxidase family protein [Streptomyces sp. MST-110588]
MHEHDSLRTLGRTACLRLLGRVPLGRVVYTENALPAVLPVNFCLDQDGAVLLRTSATSQMAGAVDDSVVAFEADHFDETTRTGWSVVVTGRATVVTSPGEIARLDVTVPHSWVPMDEPVFVRIAPELITGRDLGPTTRSCTPETVMSQRN